LWRGFQESFANPRITLYEYVLISLR
jgi:hypothetical protein